MKSVRPKLKSAGRGGDRRPCVSLSANSELVEDDLIKEKTEEFREISSTDSNNVMTFSLRRPCHTTQPRNPTSDQNNLAREDSFKIVGSGSVQKLGHQPIPLIVDEQKSVIKSVLVEEELKLVKRMIELEWREQELERREEMMKVKEGQKKKSPRELFDRQIRDINISIRNKRPTTGSNEQDKQVHCKVKSSDKENQNMISNDRDILMNGISSGSNGASKKRNVKLEEFEEMKMSEGKVKYEEETSHQMISDQERAIMYIPVSVTGYEGSKPLKPLAQFSDSGMWPVLLENIDKCGYREPTPVQKYAIPIVLAGRDLMACAQTGAGKTAAYLLPIIKMLIDCGIVSPTATPQALIISSTRELTIQIYNLAKKLTKGSMVKPAVLYYYKHNQADELGEGCNILVATLGRLLEYVDKDLVSLSNIKVMVLDEADLLLHRRNWPKIDRCVENMPRKRQTLMFSAKFPYETQMAAQHYIEDYLFLTVADEVKAFEESYQVKHNI